MGAAPNLLPRDFREPAGRCGGISRYPRFLPRATDALDGGKQEAGDGGALEGAMAFV